MKNKFTMLCMMCMLVFGFSVNAFAQNAVNGTVTDADTKEALSAALVLVKGTQKGVLTDDQGKYRITVEEGDVLVFSYVGYGEQEMTVGTSSTIDVSMTSATILDEVVVIGYGTVKKTDVTGSVSKVDEDDFNRGAITSPEQLLDGRAPGIQVVGASGAPGAAINVNIRGTSSIRSGNNPLIVIDGVQLDNRSPEPGGDVSSLGRAQGSNPFAFIDPNQIESIEVLKDASATAIYGSRGANGVILITTKKGSAARQTVEYSAQIGFSSILKRPDILDGNAYRSALATENLPSDNDFGADINAMDSIMQTGITNSHSFSASGGGAGYNYRVFGTYFDQTGIIQESGLTKFVGGAKSSFKVLEDRVTIDMNVTASSIEQQDAPISDDAGFEGSLIGAALQWNPTRTLTTTDSTGSVIFDQSILENRNPLALLNYIDDQTNTTRIIANVAATVNLAKGLDFKSTVSLDNASAERRVGVDPALNLNDIFGRGQAIVGNNRLGSVQWSNTLNYRTDIGDKFNLNLLGGYEYLKYTNKGTNIFVTDLATGFPFDYTDILQSAANTNQRVESFHDPDIELQSYFARGIFNYDDKYLLTATVRADGSSKVGENNTYGVFPSFAAAWNIHNESFAGETFDNLKLRLGWGQTGNQEFPAGAAQTYFQYENGNLTQRNAANPDLRWETTTQMNIGLDFAILDYRVSGTIDYFNRSTDDLILFVPLAQPNPSTEGRIYRNVDGTIINSGIELGVNAYIISRDNFKWGAGLNATFLSNKVEDFSTSINTGAINGQGLTGAFAQRIENGQSLFSYYLPVYAGLNGEGLSTYEDPVNGGTTIIGTVNSVKQFVGDPLPDVLLGFSTDFEIGNLDILLNLNGMFGYEVYNNTANAVFVKGNIANGRNITTDLVGNNESLNNSYPASTRYLEKGDHIRVSNLTVGYTFDNFKKALKGMRIAVTGQNLLLITGYSGFDPVVNTNKEISGIPSFGIEYTPFPTSRTILFNVSLNL